MCYKVFIPYLLSISRSDSNNKQSLPTELKSKYNKKKYKCAFRCSRHLYLYWMLLLLCEWFLQIHKYSDKHCCSFINIPYLLIGCKIFNTFCSMFILIIIYSCRHAKGAIRYIRCSGIMQQLQHLYRFCNVCNILYLHFHQ